MQISVIIWIISLKKINIFGIGGLAIKAFAVEP